MKTVWAHDGKQREMTAPLSLIVSAFAPVADISKTLTPQLCGDEGDTDLLLVDLGAGKNRLGGSALAQVFDQTGDTPPDVDAPASLREFFNAIQALNADGKLLAYHDRSDGGVFVTVCEMAFAGRTGVTVSLDALDDDPLAALFSEELGAVVQVKQEHREAVLAHFAAVPGLAGHVHVLGTLNHTHKIEFLHAGRTLLSDGLFELHHLWSETTFQMQALRDDPECAKEEFNRLLDVGDPGLYAEFSFDAQHDITAPYVQTTRPRVAILREQGVNGQVEMAAAFDRARFEAVDVHMSDILGGALSLDDFQGLATCGGFSYGDVLGAGGGWAGSVRFNQRARDQFANFFQRPDTFTLGVCNGCQMLAHLKDLIPGAETWPKFVRNRSEQFEARLVMAEVLESPSIFLSGMTGSHLPLVVAHGEGRVQFTDDSRKHEASAVACLRYVDNHGHPAERYPANPNGSPGGITGFTTVDGRASIMMPHPERLFRTAQYSWHPPEWGDDGPWLRMFRAARVWID